MKGKPLADFYARDPGIMSRLTAWVTSGRREKMSLATHQGKFIDEHRIIHALQKEGVVIQSWQLYADHCKYIGKELCILVPPYEFSHPQIMTGRRALEEMIGWKYSKLELWLQALDGLIAKIFRKNKIGLDAIVFRRLGDYWKKGVICSKTANRADIAMSIIPPEYEYASPDDSYDYKIANGWKVLWASENWYKGF